MDIESDKLTYWIKKLSTESPDIIRPFTQVRPDAIESRSIRSHNFYLSDRVYEQMEVFCRRRGISHFVLILSVLKVLLYRYSGESDIRVGCNTSGHIHQGTESSVKNTLVIRSNLADSMTVDDVLKLIQTLTVEAFLHRDIPFARVVKEIKSICNHITPIFQIMINVEDGASEYPDIWELGIEGHHSEGETVSVDLNLVVKETSNNLNFTLYYHASVFFTEAIVRMANHFTQLLDSFVNKSSTPISVLPILTREETEGLLKEWTSPCVRRSPQCIHQVFEQQVDSSPHQVATIFNHTELTYQELDDRANQLAHYLNRVGMKPHQTLAVCLDRTPELIVSFISVLKTGGAYVPLDPKYPPERITYVIHDANVSFLITTSHIAAKLHIKSTNVILIDKLEGEIRKQPSHRLPFRSKPDDLAYILYTSGSTGQPKGVCVPHRGVWRLVKDNGHVEFGASEVFLSLSTVSFDASVFEIFGAVLNGGKLILLNPDTPPLRLIGEVIRQKGVTTINVTPTMLDLLLTECSHDMQALKQIVVGGDVLPVRLARDCIFKIRNAKLINAYGPTENSVDSLYYHVRDIPSDATSIPIGRPISNDNFYILDQHLRPVPPGVIGELYVSGDGVALGYLHDPKLTQEHFISNPFLTSTHSKLYRTGDFVRYNFDKNVEFVGRRDQQIKIRGCRVELGEIVARLNLYPGMRHAVVTVSKIGGRPDELIAYILLAEGVPFDPSRLRLFVQERLPNYMVPAIFVELENVPLTIAGKIDQRQLPDPISNLKNDKLVTARNRIELQLIEIWKELLSVDDVGVNQEFYSLGGHSLLVMKMFAAIEKRFNKRFPPSLILEAGTIEQLALKLAIHNVEDSHHLVTIQSKGAKNPLFCIHNLSGEVVAYQYFAKHFGEEQPIYGLHLSESEHDSPGSIVELASRYVKEIRRIQASGPYLLVGHSLGGVIAFEMARQLAEQGESIQMLAMLDTQNPLVNRRLRRRIYNNIRISSKLPLRKLLPFSLLKIYDVYRWVQTRFQVIQSGGKTSATRLEYAMDCYETTPFPGKILLFRAVNRGVNDIVLELDEKLGWSGFAMEVDVYHIPGDHNSLLKEPNVKQLVKYLRLYMENLHEGTSTTEPASDYCR